MFTVLQAYRRLLLVLSIAGLLWFAILLMYAPVQGSPALPDADTSARLCLSDQGTTYSSTVYLPSVLRRWPPVPYPPVLSPVTKLPRDTAYTLYWTVPVSSSEIFSYTVQESSTPSFSAPIEYTTVYTTYAFNDKPSGDYYYRVRAHNLWGGGEWSNVIQASVNLAFRDDFNDITTGWQTCRTSAPTLDDAVVEYSGTGQLITRVESRWDFGVFSPLQPAPEPPYRIVLKSRIIHLANLTSYGIVFGGNEGTECQIDRSNAGDPNGCFYHYYRLNVIWGGFLKFSVKRVDSHLGGEDGRGKGYGVELMPYHDVSDLTSADDWNTWEIRVYPNGFSVYVNGNLVGWSYDTTYINDPFFGIFTSTDEYNGSRWEHEYFYVVPLDPGASLPSMMEGYEVPGMNWYIPYNMLAGNQPQ